ncbi:MAG: hypothetical protein RLY61_211 [Candidatus Parcubacteria bacterium]|jgi:hypothetical protein
MAKYKPNQNMTEEELYSKLFTTLFAIVVLLGIIFLGFRYFGPKIGSFFGLISVNRNDTGSKDAIAPLPPEFINPPKATNKQSVDLTGSAEPGSTVTLFVNGPKKADVLVDQSGEFNFSTVSISRGKNSIFATATDDFGNKSEKSETVIVMYDNSKPKITLTEPKEGQKVQNLQNRVLIKGTLNEKAEVTINGRVAITRPDNSFELLLGVKEGDLEIEIKAVDEAGNTNTKKVGIFFQND